MQKRRSKTIIRVILILLMILSIDFFLLRNCMYGLEKLQKYLSSKQETISETETETETEETVKRTYEEEMEELHRILNTPPNP